MMAVGGEDWRGEEMAGVDPIFALIVALALALAHFASASPANFAAQASV